LCCVGENAWDAPLLRALCVFVVNLTCWPTAPARRGLEISAERIHGSTDGSARGQASASSYENGARTGTTDSARHFLPLRSGPGRQPTVCRFLVVPGTGASAAGRALSDH